MKLAFWLAFPLWMIMCASLVLAQEKPATWFDIPSNKGAVALIIDGDLQHRIFTVKDYKNVLDSKVWDSKLPLLQQYRLMPGVYQIVVQTPSGAKTVTVDVKENELSVVKISAESGLVSSFKYSTDYSRDNVKKLVQSFYDAGFAKSISPVELSPDANIIFVDTTPPYAIPPPPPPTPKQ